jgi:hypothetical protein
MSKLKSNLRKYNKGHCPECGDAGKPIIYGLIREEGDGSFIRGGCSIVPGFDPTDFCEGCSLEFGFGGRDFKTDFVIEIADPSSPSGVASRSINLMVATEDELIAYAATLIEARHELLFRGFPEAELNLLGMTAGWKSYPMERMFDIWFYWNHKTQLIEFASLFAAHGVAHVHGLFRPDREGIRKIRNLEEFDNWFNRQKNPNLRAFNLRPPFQRSEWRNPDHELIQLMKANRQVSESLMTRFANPVPDGQLFPSWYEPDLDYLS